TLLSRKRKARATRADEEPPVLQPAERENRPRAPGLQLHRPGPAGRTEDRHAPREQVECQQRVPRVTHPHEPLKLPRARATTPEGPEQASIRPEDPDDLGPAIRHGNGTGRRAHGSDDVTQGESVRAAEIEPGSIGDPPTRIGGPGGLAVADDRDAGAVPHGGSGTEFSAALAARHQYQAGQHW